VVCCGRSQQAAGEAAGSPPCTTATTHATRGACGCVGAREVHCQTGLVRIRALGYKGMNINNRQLSIQSAYHAHTFTCAPQIHAHTQALLITADSAKVQAIQAALPHARYDLRCSRALCLVQKGACSLAARAQLVPVCFAVLVLWYNLHLHIACLTYTVCAGSSLSLSLTHWMNPTQFVRAR